MADTPIQAAVGGIDDPTKVRLSLFINGRSVHAPLEDVVAKGGASAFATVFVSKSADYTAVAADNNAVIRFTAAATLSLPASSGLGNGWKATVSAGGGDVAIDPNGSETIDGATAVTLLKGHSLTLVCDGTGFFVIGANDSEPVGRISLQNGALDAGCIRFGEGGSYVRADYPDLAAWMDANGATTLGLSASDVANGILPDWRDYSVRTSGGSLGPATGAKQQDAFQGHFHSSGYNSAKGYTTGAVVGDYLSNSNPTNATNLGVREAITDGTNGTPRTASETRVKSVGIRWQIKAKRTY